MRTGSEPATARSALRARFWLSLWGLCWAVFGTVAFALAGHPGWAAVCGVLWLLITVDMTVILRHIRQGPHYQPGRDVPPYRPPDGPPYPQPPRRRHLYRGPPRHHR
ncbi:integral membrane protein [Streptomyces hygroscopicus subsp. jinggangensis 5008]|nr:integral membrane protein [Streptomyces hygroscopicus subsp. jinggangensis 5008]AGF62893.1 integral membrane protein [Streptomyces hygroscopicus subsp. jinggangensis TL01]